MANKFFIDNEQVSSDFHCKWLNLPKTQCHNNIKINYRIGTDGGFFFEDKRCILQIIRRNKICTVCIWNDGGFMVPLYGNYSIDASFLNKFDQFFNITTPQKIREYYPLLNILIEHKTPMKGLEFYCFKDSCAGFLINNNEPIKGDKFTESQIKLIVKAIDCIMDIEDEFLSFKQSKYYVALDKYFKENKLKNKEHENNIALYATLTKLALIGLRLYNASGSGGGDINGNFNGNISLDNVDLSMNDAIAQLDTNSDVLAYFVSPDNSMSDGGFIGGNGEYISFTGSDNSQQIASLQSDLNSAKHDIDYYTREINNFNDKTSSTYRSNCLSALNRATQKAAELSNKIQQLKK